MKRIFLAAFGAMLALPSCSGHRQPSTDTVFVSDQAGGVTLVDGATGKMLDSVPVGGRPRFVLFFDRGRSVWVSSEQRGMISVFDASTRKLQRTIDLTQMFDVQEPVQAIEMRATKDESRVFVAMGR